MNVEALWGGNEETKRNKRNENTVGEKSTQVRKNQRRTQGREKGINPYMYHIRDIHADMVMKQEIDSGSLR